MQVLIVDDHALVRDALAAAVGAVRPNAAILQAASCGEALAIATATRCDLALLDLQLPDQPGHQALELFRRIQPQMPVVIVSGVEDRDTVLRALDAGASAFVPKSASSDRLRSALFAVLDGRVTLPDTVLANAPGVPPSRHEGANAWGLTERQLEVLALLVAGLPNKLIARRLAIAETTVKIHVSAILRQLRVASRTQALVAVAKYGVRLPQI